MKTKKKVGECSAWVSLCNANDKVCEQRIICKYLNLCKQHQENLKYLFRFVTLIKYPRSGTMMIEYAHKRCDTNIETIAELKALNFTKIIRK